MTTDFAGFQQALVRDVGGFGGPKAQMWIGFTGRYKDEELQLLRDWRTERYPSTCGDDALSLVASTFLIERLDADTMATWRARCENAWTLHQLSGSAPTVESELLATGVTAVVITERWQVDPTDPNYTKTEIEVEIPTWGPTVLGIPLTLPFVLGNNVPLAHVREMVRIILRHKASHCIPHYLTVTDGLGNDVDFPIYIALGDPEYTLPFKLGAPVEY
jgi:hypothetical protein